MLRVRVIVAFQTALLFSAALAQPAFAATPVESSGRTGAWSIADNSTDAALRCTYDAQDLTTLTVAPPQINAIAVRRRQVGWEFTVLRAEWWATDPDQWVPVYSSGIAKAPATRTVPAVFAQRETTIPHDVRTSYDSFKVQVTAHWFAKNRTTEIGHATVELEYYGQEQAGQPFDPSTSTYGPGHCVGSFAAPVAPPDGVRADMPAGFARMSHWRPYWRSQPESAVQADIDLLQAMHQTGVILTGMETGDHYSLPANVAHYLQMYRDAGITPYLSLWVGKFSTAETDTAVRAWQAGNGLWGGIVLDVEGGLLLTVQRTGRPAAVAALDAFMARVRPLTTLLAYSTMAIPTDYPDMLYSELNAYCDLYMPQLYFPLGNSALYLFDRMKASVDYASQFWSEAPKPMFPVVNDWGANVKPDELNDYINIAFARYGAVSGWRIHPDMQQAVKDVWGTFAP